VIARLDADAFRAVGLTAVDAVAFVASDDVGNVYAALQAQEIRCLSAVIAQTGGAHQLSQ
jgi:hypothetical protein